MATALVQEEPSEPLKYKTWILKVSIHCQGCKKKVHKILTNIPGVYRVDTEIRQQRVIVTGNVDAETLINKLIKSGKNAELWPENPGQNEKTKPAKYDDKEKQNHSQTNKDAGLGNVNGDKEIKPPAKVENAQVSAKIADPIGGGVAEIPAKLSADSKVGNVAGKVASDGGQVEKESKSEGKLPEAGSAGNKSSPPVVVKKVDEGEIGGEKSGADGGGENGNGGKKKKKKGPNSNKTVSDEPQSVSQPATVHHNGGPPPVSIPANHNPPRHQDQYQSPLHYHTSPPPPPPPPPPVYGVSYNMAHPSSSYTASYYAAQPPNSYTYSHRGSGTEPPYPYMYPGSAMEHLPGDFDPYPRQPLDSFEMFSDENPNGCSIS